MKLAIGFSKSKKKFPVGSWVIRLYQTSGYSHVYVRLMSKRFHNHEILHASEGKVIKMSENQFDKRHIVVKEFIIDIPHTFVFNKHRQQRTSLMRYIVDEMHEHSGADYSILQNLGIVVVDIFKLFGKKIKNPWITGWNCSEFAGEVLKLIYPAEFINVDMNLVKPVDVYKILESLEK